MGERILAVGFSTIAMGLVFWATWIYISAGEAQKEQAFLLTQFPARTPHNSWPQCFENPDHKMPEEIPATVRGSTVAIKNAHRIGIASGFLLGDDVVVTNHHVVTHYTGPIYVRQGNTVVEAKVLRVDPDNDLAVLEITPGALGESTLELGDEGVLMEGSEVTIASGLFGQQAFARICVNVLPNKLVYLGELLGPGTSGSPVLLDGKVIGVHAQGKGGGGVAIPASALRELLLST